MSDVSKRFEQLIKQTYKKFLDKGVIIPTKTKEGIWVGNVLIRSNRPLKTLVKDGEEVYKDISLNAVAIKLANLLARNKSTGQQQRLYKLDIEYSRHYNDSKFLLAGYHSSVNNGDKIRAEIMWTRYEIAKEKAVYAKEQAEYLAAFE